MQSKRGRIERHWSWKTYQTKGNICIHQISKIFICKWVKELTLPDGYASNLGRCVDLNQGKLHGMKSHNCHVFMQRLLTIAFDSLPKPIWKVIVEQSLFFRKLTSTTLNVEHLRILEENILVLLCKMEQIFPLGASLIPWNIFQFIFLMRKKLMVQSNIVGCIHLRGTKLLITFLQHLLFIPSFFKQCSLYSLLGS